MYDFDMECVCICEGQTAAWELSGGMTALTAPIYLSHVTLSFPPPVSVCVFHFARKRDLREKVPCGQSDR